MNLAEAFQRHWRPLVLLFWLCTAVYLIWERWTGIHGFALGDTDDNLRIMQVRALLDGQGWFDLRQYRLSPPEGLNMHWSRLPDLPIAGLYLLLKPLFGGMIAERWAVAIAPLLPLLLAMGALALAARRLLSPYAFWLGPAILVSGGSARAMFAPLRIDHHNWQLAMLAVVVAGLADPNRKRGGITVGVATALSLAIGLEMLLYLAVAGAAIGLRWIVDRAESERLASYGISLAGGTALGFLIFASEANRLPVCDALSPVWLSVMLLAGAVALVLSWLRLQSWWLRLAAGATGGALLAGFYALAWPNCLGRLEGVPPELAELWLNNVREAMPLYRHGTTTTILIAALPAIGLIGYLVMLWRTRREPDLLLRWGPIAAMAALAAALLLWQTRAAAASQLLAVMGAAGLGWTLITWFHARDNMLVRVGGIVGAFMLVSGALSGQAAGWFDKPEPMTPARQAINRANNSCPTVAALRPIAMQPRGYVLTFNDLGPRLVTLTHHDAISGPYHRNHQAILDVMHAFRGDEASAHAIIERRGIDYVLICPNMSESTIYRAAAPNGFYAQLSRGRVPRWLEPISLPANSPYRMWRVRR